jgi:hypothetical protein
MPRSEIALTRTFLGILCKVARLRIPTLQPPEKDGDPSIKEQLEWGKLRVAAGKVQAEAASKALEILRGKAKGGKSDVAAIQDEIESMADNLGESAVDQELEDIDLKVERHKDAITRQAVAESAPETDRETNEVAPGEETTGNKT